MEKQNVSILQIADRINRHPMMTDIPLETIVDYTIDFIGIVGLPEFFDEKTAVVKIENYRGVLPCDFVEMIQVRSMTHKPIYYRAATDTFHFSNIKHVKSIDPTYKIQGNIIFTSNEKGDIEISYQSIGVDEHGFPLIPDDRKFMTALEAYIKYQHFTIKFDEGIISPQVLDRAAQEYTWAVGRCESGFKMMTIDEAESIFNNWKQIIINDKEHNSGFANSGIRKNYRIH